MAFGSTQNTQVELKKGAALKPEKRKQARFHRETVEKGNAWHDNKNSGTRVKVQALKEQRSFRNVLEHAILQRDVDR